MRVVDPVWIAMPDGCRLAATLWLPEDAESSPVPCILEYLPYRRRDGTAPRDALLHPPMAAAGYACLRVDIRGTGDSDGLLADEYLPLEQEDACAVIAWAAAQRWCSGAVGMMGISWGGFNALQVAARRPPALRAIITLCSTDDRYADDTHYMGGALLTGDLTWASVMLATSAFPPDPLIVGERWRAMWRERLAAQPLLSAVWTRHQRRDAYWKQGSVCEDYAAIDCAVLAVGGWTDAYTNAVPRLLAGLRAPFRGIVGPWSHAYPHIAEPGPAIDFIGEAVRWWDHWLKGRANGAMDTPVLRAWMQDSTPPAARQPAVQGCWVAEPVWPPRDVQRRVWHLAPHALSDTFATGAEIAAICSPQDTGIASGAWCPYGLGDGPTDQRIDDGRSAVFATAPLDAPLAILGAPVVTLDVIADHPVGTVAVRLLDIAPDGASTRVSYALLALSHRDGHEHPSPCPTDARVRLVLRLNDAGWRFLAGHRIAIAISTAYWPTAWPGPEPLTLRIFGASTLELPLRAARAADETATFAPPPHCATLPHERLRAADRGRSATFDHSDQATTVTALKDRGAMRLSGIGLDVDARGAETFAIRPDDPLSARVATRWSCEMARGAWRVTVKAETAMHVDRDAFHIAARLTACEDGSVIAERTWDETIPRDLI